MNLRRFLPVLPLLAVLVLTGGPAAAHVELRVNQAAAEEPAEEAPAGGAASESVSEAARPNDAEDDATRVSPELDPGSPWLLLGGLAVVAAVAAIAISRRRGNT